MAARTPVGFRKWLIIDAGSEHSRLPASVLQIVNEMSCWIEDYVSQHLHSSGSTWDFSEQFPRRLESRISNHDSSSLKIRGVVEKTVKDLVYDQNRSELRRDRKFRSDVRVEECIDPQSLELEEKFVREAQAAAVLRAMSEEDRLLIEQLYGLRNFKAVSRREMARRLGLRRNTLDQKLLRLFRSVRKVVAP